eukprot:TRINITY_DN6493_c0_g1_i1.p2 TRINITY_DN6493_c0_g1~~TRINITY_DN6493_c0_g1_i1.p2  ORF type:complete len:61 (-),score=14.09 TRINITY_DN6493_c0_g1_i1:129-311(-)
MLKMDEDFRFTNAKQRRKAVNIPENDIDKPHSTSEEEILDETESQCCFGVSLIDEKCKFV